MTSLLREEKTTVFRSLSARRAQRTKSPQGSRGRSRWHSSLILCFKVTVLFVKEKNPTISWHFEMLSDCVLFCHILLYFVQLCLQESQYDSKFRGRWRAARAKPKQKENTFFFTEFMVGHIIWCNVQMALITSHLHTFGAGKFKYKLKFYIFVHLFFTWPRTLGK